MKKFLMSLVLLSLMFTGLAQAQFFVADEPLVGKPVPEFSLKGLDGKEQPFNQFRNGKKTIIFFWATWCPHCRKQMTMMNQEMEALAKDNVKLAAVDLGEKGDLVRSFVEKNQIKVPVYLDEDSKCEEAFNLIGLPTLIYVNADGTVKAVKHSFVQDYNKLFN
jgi:peroxiredoxin